MLLTEVVAHCVTEANDEDSGDNKDVEENDDEDIEYKDKDKDKDSNKDNTHEYTMNRSINDDNKYNIMHPKLKPAPLSPTKATHKEPRGGHVTSAVSKLKITTSPSKPYSMKTLDGYMVKDYNQKIVDFVEVDIHVGGPLPEHAYKVKLSEDGRSLIWRSAIPDFFFESRRMVSMLKKAYYSDASHVIAHVNVVQQNWNGGTESKRIHFTAEEDDMIVQLGVFCLGNARVKETLQKVDEVVDNGNTHYQFNIIYSWKVKTIKLWRTQKKKERTMCSC